MACELADYGPRGGSLRVNGGDERSDRRAEHGV